MKTAKYITSSGSKVFVSRFLSTIISIIAISITTRKLTKEEMAVVASVLILSSIVNTLRNFGLISTLARLVPEYVALDEVKEATVLIRSISFYITILSVFFSLLIFIFSQDISLLLLKTKSYNYQIKIISGIVFLLSLQELFLWILQSLKEFGKSSVFYLLTNIAQKLFSILLLFFYGLNGFLYGELLGLSIAIFYLFWHVKKYIFNGVELYPPIKLVKYSFPYYVAAVTRYMFMNLDQFIVGVFLTPVALSSYYVAKRFYDIYILLIDSILLPILPKIGEIKILGQQKIEQALKKTIKYSSYLFIPISFVIIGSSKFLIDIIAGTKYNQSVSILVVLILSSLGYMYFSILNSFAYMLGEPKVRLKFETIVGVANFILGVPLIFMFGSIGMALSLFFSMCVGTIYTTYILYKDCQIRLLIEIRSIFNTLILSFVMLIIIVLPQIFYYKLILVPFYILAGVCFFAILKLKNLEDEDIILIKEVLPTKFSDLVISFRNYLLTQNYKLSS
jgi:lipopolysaccharide exporter